MTAMRENVPCDAIRVFLLIENRLLRESLQRLFRKRNDFSVVGQTGQTDLPPEEILTSKCDVLIVASLQPNWLPEHLFLADSTTALKVLLIGMDAVEDHFMTSVRAGISGYLLKDASASDVLAAVRSVFRGEAVCPLQLCQALFQFVVQAARSGVLESKTKKPELTLRQQQLISLVAKGLTNKEIASRLNLSEFTVRNHIHRILRQVDADNRGEAVKMIRASGYTINA